MNLPDRVAFVIPGTQIAIYWYAILITFGIVIAVIVTGLFAKKRNMPADTAIDLCLWAVPLGFICARAYYVLFSLSEFHSFIEMINIRNGGLAIPGGIIGGLLGIFIYSLIKKKPIWGYLDITVPGVALAQAIGRWGNFFNQEAYGTAVTKFLYFPFVVRIEDCGCDIAGHHGHLATFFYESMFCLVIFFVLFLLTKKQKRNGDIVLTYVLMYSFERMIIEQFRMDALTISAFNINIRVTQLLCALLFCGCIVYIIVRATYEKKHDKLIFALNPDEYKSDEMLKAEAEQAERERREAEDAFAEPSQPSQTIEAEEDETIPDED